MTADNNKTTTLEKPKERSPERIKREVVNQAEIDELLISPKFSSKLLISPRTNRAFFYFRYHGQTLSGFLMDRVWDNYALNRSRSFCIITDDNIKEEFFANQRLAQIIIKKELFGKYVEITYLGDERTGYGHARKIYQVVKVSGMTDNIGFTETTESLKKMKGKSNGRSKQSGTETGRGRGRRSKSG